MYDTLTDMANGLERLKNDSSIKVVQVKNRFDPAFNVEEMGYRDLKMLVTLPDLAEGYVAEVQLHLKSIEELKTAAGHKAYVIIRDATGG